MPAVENSARLRSELVKMMSDHRPIRGYWFMAKRYSECDVSKCVSMVFLDVKPRPRR